VNPDEQYRFHSNAGETASCFTNLVCDIPINTEIDGADEILVQLKETLESINECAFSDDEKTIFVRLVAHLWNEYIDEEGNIERRKRQLNSHTNEREPELNHSLGVVELACHVLKEAHEKIKTLPLDTQRKIALLWEKRFQVLLSSLLHDVIEDEKFTKENLGELLFSENIDTETITDILHDIVLMTRPKDPNNSEKYAESLPTYLLRVESALSSTFVKGVADIGKNAQSELIGNQQEKFRGNDGYIAFFWKHWKELQTLLTTKETMEVIGRKNPKLCAVLSCVKKQTAVVITPVKTHEQKWRYCPPPQTTVHPLIEAG